jgi:pimeloyl-ACP methyl ester carboxylesterase
MQYVIYRAFVEACRKPSKGLPEAPKTIDLHCIKSVLNDTIHGFPFVRPLRKAREDWMKVAWLLALWGLMGPAVAGDAAGHYLSVGKHRLYYEIRGSGRPVVLLHGGGSTIQDSFSYQLDFLAAHHQVIAIEQRGHGHSPDTFEPLTYAGMAEDTAGVLQQLRILNADVIGFSDGAITGLILGLRHPELVRRIVASGANIDPGGLTEKSYQETLNMNPMAALTPGERAAHAAVSPDGAAHLLEFGEKLRQLWLHHPTTDEINATQLARLRRPVLVMSGDNDEVRLEHTMLIYRSLPNARLWILPATGHPTFASRPQWVNPMLESFLDEH